jgi:hypothetical protein
MNFLTRIPSANRVVLPCRALASGFSVFRVNVADKCIMQERLSKDYVLVTCSRDMAKQKAKGGKGKKGAGKKGAIDELLDELSDEDDDDDVIEDDKLDTAMTDTPLSRFMHGVKPEKGSKHFKGKGVMDRKGASHSVALKYHEVIKIVDGEALWSELEQTNEKLKSYYINQLTVRSSTSLDDLQVELEGDSYPLNELAAISKKDPTRLIIDMSSFPQASTNVMAAIRGSGMNLNPQQDGLKIAVPIPKVTKEFREKLVMGARKKAN